MPKLLSTIAILTLIGACSSNGGNGDGSAGGSGGNGASDLSASAGSASDLAAGNGLDLSAAQGCHSVASCVTGCSGNQACVQACIQSATSHGRSLYFKLVQCVRAACYPHPDSGAEPCTQNGGGAPSPACTMCVKDAEAMASSCTGQPHCGACYSQYSACQSDLP